MTSNCFSQIVINDSANTILPTPVAKQVIKDLIKYDGLKTEAIIKNKIITDKDSIIKIDSTIINKTNIIVLNLNNALKDSQEQLTQQKKITESLESDIKQQKRNTWFIGGAGVVTGILIKLLFIK